MAPPGYELKKLNSTIDLSNKQVYLAQVPKDFDPKTAEFKSDIEVACGGETYFISSSASIAHCEILSAGKDGKLAPSSAKLAGLLAFTKKVSLPKVKYEEVRTEKPAVPQKENMRMRHFATGYGPKKLGLPGTDGAGDAPQPAARRRHSETAGPDEEKKHSKKQKKSSSDEPDKKKKKKAHKHKEKS